MTQEKTPLQESCIAFAEKKLCAGATWEDSTSYSRDDKNKIPNMFSTRVGEHRITITCGHRDYRPLWVFHCFSLGFDTKTLPSGITAEQAATLAISLCKIKVNKLAEDFSKVG